MPSPEVLKTADVTFVAWLVAVTDAPATAPPFWSVTVPLSVPVVACAIAGRAKSGISIMRANASTLTSDNTLVPRDGLMCEIPSIVIRLPDGGLGTSSQEPFWLTQRADQSLDLLGVSGIRQLS